jgi:hypothetical protein
VPRQLMRNELLDVTTIVPATAYHRRSYAERYSRYSEGADAGGEDREGTCVLGDGTSKPCTLIANCNYG